MRAEGFVLLPHTNFIADGEDPAVMRMMCVGGICYLLSSHIKLPINLQSGEQLPKISLSSGDSVLGIGDNGEFPLLFTTHHGVLSVTPTQVTQVSSMQCKHDKLRMGDHKLFYTCTNQYDPSIR